MWAETDTCPRRIAIRNPWISRALDLYGHTEGRLGVDGLKMSNIVSDAIGTIDDGKNYRLEQEAERRRAEAERKRSQRGN